MITKAFLQEFYETEKGAIEIPFIIIRARQYFTNDYSSNQFLFVFDNAINIDDDTIRNQIDISKSMAMFFIRKFDMHLALTTKDGVIYEQPGNPFYGKFSSTAGGPGVEYCY